MLAWTEADTSLVNTVATSLQNNLISFSGELELFSNFSIFLTS